ncbi:MAG: ABC transporter ATP-binding protein, partial [Peptidiphaga gingivicola]
RILLGLDRADSGSALFGGKRYRDIDRPLTRVGALFDGLAGNKMRSVASHLAIVAESNGIPHARVSQTLEQTGLSAKRKSRLGTLSLGEGQRLGLAVALLGEPQFLVLDEPTNGLDPAGIRWFRNFVREQAALGRTVLLSSHALSEVQAVADRAVVISKGSILLDSPLAEATEKISSLEDLFFELTEGVA